MRPGCWAWVGLWTGVAVWDTFCPKDEQLTDAARRGVKAHPVLTLGGIIVTALHLSDRIPPRADPFYFAGCLLAHISTARHRGVNC
ncbi:MAG: hypothetical protein CK431_16970 [Mycobacterium sp.]|nr:MAG: hypothetical protein CK431_16970 [Mycobacterium sp.]